MTPLNLSFLSRPLQVIGVLCLGSLCALAQSTPADRGEAKQCSSVFSKKDASKALFQYKSLALEVLRLKRLPDGSVNASTIAALDSELKLRRSQLLALGLSPEDLKFSSTDTTKIKKATQQKNKVTQSEAVKASLQTKSILDESSDWIIDQTYSSISSGEKMILSPNGKLLITYWGQRVSVYNAESGDFSFDFDHEKPITDIAISSDGKWIAVAAFDKTVQLWDVKAKRLGPVLTVEKSVISKIAFVPGNKTLLTGSVDGSIREWDIPTGTNTIVTSSSGSIKNLSVSKDGLKILSIDNTYSFDMYNLSTKRWVRIDPLDGKDYNSDFELLYSAFSPDSQKLAGIDNSQTLYIYDVNSKQQILPPARDTFDYYGLAFSPTNQILAAIGGEFNRQVSIITTSEAETIQSIELQNKPLQIAFSPDGSKLYVSTLNNQVVVLKRSGKL